MEQYNEQHRRLSLRLRHAYRTFAIQKINEITRAHQKFP